MPTTNSLGESLTQTAIQALPPEIQSIIKTPGKTSDRIKSAINWAARRDPNVLKRHQARNASVHTFEDIRNVPVADMDAVARKVARTYRHRAGAVGAASGLPGGVWALVAAGADVQLTAVFAVRMAAGIAQAYGYDTTDVEEQAQLADVLAIAAGIDSLRGVGTWLSREGLIYLLPEVLPKILVRLSLELTQEQAAKLIGRIVPGVGAIVSGAIDYTFLRVAGDRAIRHYHARYLAEHGQMLPGGQAAPALPPASDPAADPSVPVAPIEGSLAAGAAPAAIADGMTPPTTTRAPQPLPAGMSAPVLPLMPHPKSAGLATVLEFLFPGIGALYLHRNVAGMFWLVLSLLASIIFYPVFIRPITALVNGIVTGQFDFAGVPTWVFWAAGVAVLWLGFRLVMVARYAHAYEDHFLTRAPESYAARFITFGVLALIATLLACGGLLYLLFSNIGHLFGAG